MKKGIVLILLLATLISCDKDNDSTLDPMQVTLVTGINLSNSFAQPLGILGNPNVKSGTVVVYPKPTNDLLNVASIASIKNIWLLRGNVATGYENTNFSSVFSENDYDLTEIQNAAVRDFSNLSGTDIVLNVSDMGEGYYRIFVQLNDDSLVWDNIYIGNSVMGNFENINFWN